MRALFLLLLLPACSSSRPLERGPISGSHTQSVGARTENAAVEANWKERLAQPYVYLEQRGDYRRLGETLQRMLAEAQDLGLQSDGPPFALFFDDPGVVAVQELCARVCFPVTERPNRLGAFEYDLLPRAMVVYARIPGTHEAVSRGYPALFSFLRELGWQQGGPVREVYLMSSSEAAHEELVTEVQIPWAARVD